MFAKQWSSGLHGGAWLILLLFFPSLISADSLVTRDDFVCWDTIWFYPEGKFEVNFPSVSLDGEGIISQINFFDTVLGGGHCRFIQYNRFDKYGNQMQPVTNLTDVVDSLGWECDVTGLTRCSENELGLTFIPAIECRVRAYRIDSTGQSTGFPACLNCDQPDVLDYNTGLPFGGVNTEGVVAAAWRAERHVPPLDDSVFARLYYPDADSLSPLLNPASLPHPLEGDPLYEGWYNIPRDPIMKVADDGSFAIAWNVALGWWHTYYAVYNADYTPKADVRMADCDAGFFDTAQCQAGATERVEMAMEADGDFYIGWCKHICCGYPISVAKHVFIRGFHADGTPKYDPVRVSDYDTLGLTPWQELVVRMACDDSGNVLVVWADCRDRSVAWGDSPRDVYAQKVDPDGQLIGPNYRVNNKLGGIEWAGNDLDCAMNNAGQTVIIWLSNLWPDLDIYAQLTPYHDIGTFTPGDINLDFSCNVNDLVYFVDHLFFDTIYPFWPRDLIDLDGDDHNGNVVDLVYLVDYIFFDGPEPVTPYEGVRQPPPHYSSASGDAAQDPQDLAPRMDIDQPHRADSAEAWPFGK